MLFFQPFLLSSRPITQYHIIHYITIVIYFLLSKKSNKNKKVYYNIVAKYFLTLSSYYFSLYVYLLLQILSYSNRHL